MAKKIENNFYDRFLAIKPPNISEVQWFAKFGWQGNGMSTRALSWKKIEFPDPRTVLTIRREHPMPETTWLYLQYGDEVERLKTLFPIVEREHEEAALGE